MTQNWTTYAPGEVSDGWFLNTTDFDGDDSDPQPIHYTELVGSKNPELVAAYQFFKWMAEDKNLNVFKFFDRFGCIHLYEDVLQFGFIITWSKGKSRDQKWVREFISMIDKNLDNFNDKLSDLLALRGISVSLYQPFGVPVRQLSLENPQKIQQVDGWEKVHAAWIGDSPFLSDGSRGYARGDAFCEKCGGRLKNVYCDDSAEWIENHLEYC